MKIKQIGLKDYSELIQLQQHYLSIVNEVSPKAKGTVRGYLHRLEREINARKERKRVAF
ncbi:hypothetical protein HC931_16895 [Candidatus Gracilibacteria bacterium]|jgi:hypothetical protein|nr:hypothetical protein [Candidatus Gracilibacteria bacterium]NJM88949.1 hypothetical protein [Hydrococcus sp. RU_2_2]NJP20419.1 hypothetical protein [Hydrococcus sp. CRU_1_1]NJQ96941.1 hypothetical protein [Hydrococcus sp. CSU_1_8]